MERLQKVIAQAGIASRRKAEEYILAGRVKVNGIVVDTLGAKVSPSDEIQVDNIKIKKEEKVYFLMNKPKHTLCTSSDDHSRTTVLDYFADVNQRVFTVGRLDYDTTGVLIVTNDGEFANALMHPRNHIEKTYLVTINGFMQEYQAKKLEKGILLEGKMTLPAKCYILNSSKNKQKSIIQLTIQEGRNHQVKKMMEYFGFSVTRLERIQYGFLDCGKLRQGEYRRLRKFEVNKLLKMVNQSV